MPAPYIPSSWQISTGPTVDDADLFPLFPGRNFSVLKTPTFSTGKKVATSGRSVRTAFWSYPIWNFKLSHEVLRDRLSLPEIGKLWGFFANHLGGFAAFYLYDPADNTVTNWQFGTGDGSTTAFALTRGVAPGTAFAFTEPVLGLLGTPTIKVAGTPTSAYTLGSANGQIVFNSPPANGAALTWSGQFLFLCLFPDDKLDTTQLFADLWGSQGLNFESVKI